MLVQRRISHAIDSGGGLKMAQTCNCVTVEHKITEERLKDIKKVSRQSSIDSNTYACVVVYKTALPGNHATLDWFVGLACVLPL